MSTTLEQAARIAVAHLHEVHPLALWLVTEVDGGHQRVVTSAGPWSGRFPTGATLPWLGSLALAMAAGGPTTAPDISRVPRYLTATTEPRAGVRGYVGVPVAGSCLDGGDDLLACLSGVSDVHDDPTITAAASDAVVLGRLLSVVADAGRAADRHDDALTEAARHSWTDALTGLGNRRAWDDALAVATRRSGRSGVIAVDLDGLKHLNDTHGHAVGDTRLQQAAHALVAGCRPDDVIARPGGDEFTVLAVDVGLNDLLHLGDRLRLHLQHSDVPASLGLAHRRLGEDLADTWTRADLAMLEDKRSRRVGRGAPSAFASAEE
ncbi:GGDEF domain-containing protein [Aquipuribacter sp. MA13-6]|uniref:GGDEF domain-containing protein n=1 Tax=unclassified Aquipuribacter TaxID=2635084 RepID=UPI003EEF5E2D